jgi:DNA-binding transcriptional MerR regulator
MPYSVNQLATLAGVSVRTLHYYDEVGLLKPSRIKHNDYRQYDEVELLRLQQIMFFRELDFSLEQIKKILSAPSFEIQTALEEQKKLIKIKRHRLDRLIATIDKTIKKINHEIIMEDQELYGNFSKSEMDKYAQEAKDRWGHTDVFKQSQERVKKMGRAGLAKVMKEASELTQEIAGAMKADPDPKSEAVQKLIGKHYEGLRAFYEPNLSMYAGMAKMYVSDPRFKANYEKVATGLAEFMRDGMLYFVEMSKENQL